MAFRFFQQMSDSQDQRVDRRIHLSGLPPGVEVEPECEVIFEDSDDEDEMEEEKEVKQTENTDEKTKTESDTAVAEPKTDSPPSQVDDSNDSDSPPSRIECPPADVSGT